MRMAMLAIAILALAACKVTKDEQNDTITADEPTEVFLKHWCPNTPITRPLGEREAPLSNRKIREVLGFKEEHDWRKYV